MKGIKILQHALAIAMVGGVDDEMSRLSSESVVS